MTLLSRAAPGGTEAEDGVFHDGLAGPDGVDPSLHVLVVVTVATGNNAFFLALQADPEGGVYQARSPPTLGIIRDAEQRGNLQRLTAFRTALMAGFFREDWTMIESPVAETSAGHSGQSALTCRSHALTLKRKSLG